MPRKIDVPNTTWDTTDPGGTYRLNEPLVNTCGTHFDSLDIQKRDPVVQGLPDTTLGIF